MYHIICLSVATVKIAFFAFYKFHLKVEIDFMYVTYELKP